MELKYQIKEKDDLIELTFNGDIMDETIDVFNSLINIVMKSEYKEVSLNFQAIDHITSAGIGRLLLMRRNLLSRCEDVKLSVLMNSKLAELFYELKMEKLFVIIIKD